MTPIQIVAVCLRFLAIAWFLYALNSAYGTFQYLSSQNEWPMSRWVVWVMAGLQVAICAVLWFFPVTIASKLLPSYVQSPAPETSFRMEQWQTLGIALIGLLVVAHAGPDLVYWFVYMSVTYESAGSFDQLVPDQKAAFITTIFQIVIGIGLALGAKSIATLLFKMRTAGVGK